MSLSVDRFDLPSLLIPQDTEGARQRWGAQLNGLYPSNTIYFDYHGVYGGEWPSDRRSAAYGLFTQFHEVMGVVKNESERARRRSNYTLAQAIVTPVHRLPEELLTDIFMIHRDIASSRSRYPFEVCRRWHSLLQHIPAFWSILTIRTWTDMDYVHSFLSRGKNKSLHVIIYADDRSATILNTVRPYEALSLVVRSAERLVSLTLPGSDTGLIEPLPTPLRNNLLSISATAKGLQDLRMWDDHYIFILSRPSHATIFSCLTNLDVRFSGRHEPVNILPHLLVIQALALTKVALVDYDANKPLPLSNTLVDLSLSHTSIQWMVGKEFKRLIACEIYFPYRHHIIHPITVILPVCEYFVYHAQPLVALRGFVIPSLRFLDLKNKNSDKSRNVMEIQHIQNILLSQMPLVSLVLEVECHDQDLLGALRLLPCLTELDLRLRQPQGLGWRFFSGLLASMCSNEGGCGHWWCALFGGAVGQQHITICPLLEKFTISYDRWLRNTETEVVLPILPAIVESRRAAGKQIHEFIFGRANQPQLDFWDIEMEYPEIQAIYGAFQSVIQHQSIHLINQKLQAVLYLSHRPFSAFLHHISELVVFMDYSWTFPDPLDLLRYCKMLKSLSLKGLLLLPYPELPLSHTLCRMTLTETSLSWMNGHRFTSLRECRIVKPDQEECSKLLMVYLPACTLLECSECPLALLPKLYAPHLQSLMVGPIGFTLPWRPDPGSHLVRSWVLQFEFPPSWGPLNDELDVVSHLKMAGSSLVWPGGTTSQKLRAHALVERQLVYAEVDEITGKAGSWFQFADETDSGWATGRTDKPK